MDFMWQLGLLHIPQEIHDYILDHLWDDRFTLKKCSLTCRAWLPASRYHLFDTVHIRSSDDCARFRRLLDSSTPLPSVDLTYYIRGLSFQDLPFRGLDTARLSRTFSRLHRVEHLELRHWPNEDLPENLIGCLAVGFPNIKVLRLEEVEFKDTKDLLQLICAFPKLSDLFVKGAFASPEPTEEISYFGISSPYLVQQIEVPDEEEDEIIEIKKLDLQCGMQGYYLAEWLSKYPFRLRLEELSLLWYKGTKHFKQAMDILKTADVSLKKLHLSFIGHDDQCRTLLSQTIRRLRLDVLEHLSVGPLRLTPSESFITGDTFWLPELLLRIHASVHRLQTLTISVAVGSTKRHLRWIDLSRIDNILVRLLRKFPQLTVIFAVVTPDTTRASRKRLEGYNHVICSRLPELLQAGRIIERSVAPPYRGLVFATIAFRSNTGVQNFSENRVQDV